MEEQTPQQFSPVPQKLNKIQTLTFFEALKQVADGKKITKLEWNDKDIYGELVDGKVTIHLKDGLSHPWTISDGDLNGSDWIVI
jgi:hypothetical protein